jgi:hypothetical protein
MPKDAKNTRTGTATDKPSASLPVAQKGSGPQSSTSAASAETPASKPPASESTASFQAASASKPRKKPAARLPQDVNLGEDKPKGKPRGRMGGNRPGAGRKPKHITELHRELFCDAERMRTVHGKIYDLAMSGDLDAMKYYMDRGFGKPTQTTATLDNPPDPLIVEGLGPDEVTA